MPRSGCSALHGVNPNLKKRKKNTHTQGKITAEKLNIAWNN